MIDPAFPALSHALSASVLWRIGTRLVDALAAAWSSSMFVRLLNPVRARMHSALIAWIAVTGSALALMLQSAIPAYVRPGLPWMWPLAAIVFALLVATNRRAIEAAWPDSALARLLAPRCPQR